LHPFGVEFKCQPSELNPNVALDKYVIDLQHVINGLKKLKPRNDKRKINPEGMK